MSSSRAASKPSRTNTRSAASSSLPRVASVRAFCFEIRALFGAYMLLGAGAVFIRGLEPPACFTGYIHECILLCDALRTQGKPVAAVAAPMEIATWRPRYNPWLIALTVTLATFMEVLDTSIAN